MEQILEAGIKGNAGVISAFGTDELLSPMSQVEISDIGCWWGRGGAVESPSFGLFQVIQGAWNLAKKCKTVEKEIAIEIKVLTSALRLISFRIGRVFF